MNKDIPDWILEAWKNSTAPGDVDEKLYSIVFSIMVGKQELNAVIVWDVKNSLYEFFPITMLDEQQFCIVEILVTQKEFDSIQALLHKTGIKKIHNLLVKPEAAEINYGSLPDSFIPQDPNSIEH